MNGRLWNSSFCNMLRTRENHQAISVLQTKTLITSWLTCWLARETRLKLSLRAPARLATQTVTEAVVPAALSCLQGCLAITPIQLRNNPRRSVSASKQSSLIGLCLCSKIHADSASALMQSSGRTALRKTQSLRSSCLLPPGSARALIQRLKAPG